MKVVFFVLECTEYDFLQECYTPNIKSVEIHPAWSWGRMTRASVPALLGGLLPECIYKGCYHNKVAKKLVNPFFLTDLKRKGIPTLLYVANGWVMEFLKPFIPDWLWKMLNRQNTEGFNTKEFIDDFLSREPSLNDYFTYFHVQETHPPFFSGTDTELPKREGFDNIRQKAVEYADNLFKPLLNLNLDLLVVTSDHHILHDYWHPRSYDVFIGMKGKWVEEVKT